MTRECPDCRANIDCEHDDCAVTTQTCMVVSPCDRHRRWAELGPRMLDALKFHHAQLNDSEVRDDCLACALIREAEEVSK